MDVAQCGIDAIRLVLYKHQRTKTQFSAGIVKREAAALFVVGRHNTQTNMLYPLRICLFILLLLFALALLQHSNKAAALSHLHLCRHICCLHSVLC